MNEKDYQRKKNKFLPKIYTCTMTSGNSVKGVSAMISQTWKSFLNRRMLEIHLGLVTENYQAMLTNWMKNLEVGIPALLEDGIKMLIYAGEYDLICNWLEWSGQKAFVSAQEMRFLVDGAEAGVLKSHGPLSFLKVHDAGHMVSMDQPKAVLDMLKRWTQGKLADASF